MEWLLAGVGILILLSFIFIRNKKRQNDAELDDNEIEINKKELLHKEYQFTILGTKDNAKLTSRNRQMLLMEMNSYDEVILYLNKERQEPPVMVLNSQGYDIGYLRKEDQELILPYMEKDNYKIESGVERFYRNEQGENLVIYVTILEQ